MQNTSEFHIDRLVRIALIAGITYLALQLLSPMFGMLAWAFILAVALYPIYNWLNVRLGNHSAFSATLIVLLCLLLVVGTIGLLANNLVDTLRFVIEHVRAGEQIVPQPPAAIANLPLIGEPLFTFWSSASTNIAELITKEASYFVKAGSYLLEKLANKGFDLLMFMVSVIFSGYLMTQHMAFMRSARKFAERVAMERGANVLKLLRETIQNVSRGVIGVSILQTILFGLLLLAADVPGAGFLSFVALILCIMQAGLVLLVIPVIIWLFYAKSFVFALIISFLLVLVLLLDSFLKPLVMARGLSTPMMIIFLGLIGGLITYGFIGVFIGPVVIAIFYDMVQHWLG